MIDVIRSLPRQISHTIASFPPDPIRKRKIDKVLVAGMGGSGISGDLLRVVYPDILIINNKDYLVPGFVDKKTLAILISYSGNTEETLSNYDQIRKRGSSIVILTSNGNLAGKKCSLQVNVPKGLPPRGAIGYLYAPLPIILHRFGLVAKDPTRELKDLAEFIGEYSAALERGAKKISRRIFRKLAILYANSALFHVVAQRWQCQLNENAKCLAHVNVIPEMNHNEIVGLGRPKAINRYSAVIFLNDPDAYQRNKLRVKILKKTIRQFMPEIIDVIPPGRSRLQRAFALIMLGDFVSYYCAIADRIDPLPVKRIDHLKKQLALF